MPIHYLWSPHGVRDEIYEQNYTVKPDFYVNIISQKGLVEYVYIYMPLKTVQLRYIWKGIINTMENSENFRRVNVDHTRFIKKKNWILK